MRSSGSTKSLAGRPVAAPRTAPRVVGHARRSCVVRASKGDAVMKFAVPPPDAMNDETLECPSLRDKLAPRCTFGEGEREGAAGPFEKRLILRAMTVEGRFLARDHPNRGPLIPAPPPSPLRPSPFVLHNNWGGGFGE